MAGAIPGIVASRSGAFVPPSAFNYAAFLSGKSGDAWLAGELCYEDASRTTPATAGNTVYWMDGQGSQFNFTQATSANRPTLQVASGKPYLQYDGSNDRMAAGAAGNWNYLHNSAGDAYVALAISFGASSNPNAFFYGLATYGYSQTQIGWAMAYDDRSASSFSDAYRIGVGKGSAPTVFDQASQNAIPPQTDVVLEYIKNGTSVEGRVNGVLLISGTLASPSASNSNGALVLGDSPTTSTSRLNGRVYGAICCNGLPDSTQRAAILTDMAARCATPPTIS
jgi:hypothetical protein